MEVGALSEPLRPSIVVGVAPDIDDRVIRHAAWLARGLRASLVCVVADPNRYRVDEGPYGMVVSADLDPDDPEEWTERFDPELRQRVEALLRDSGVEWTPRAVAGDPADELTRIADELDAALIVVGTRRAGAWGSLREFLNGSVGARLAHRQRRPVVLVPLTPVPTDEELPWRAEP